MSSPWSSRLMLRSKLNQIPAISLLFQGWGGLGLVRLGWLEELTFRLTQLGYPSQLELSLAIQQQENVHNCESVKNVKNSTAWKCENCEELKSVEIWKMKKAWKCANFLIMGKIKQHEKKMAGPLLERLSTLKLYINNVIRWLIIREIPVKFLLDLLNISEWSDVFIFINSRINIFEMFEIFDTDRFNRSPGSLPQLTNFARKYKSVQKQNSLVITTEPVFQIFLSFSLFYYVWRRRSLTCDNVYNSCYCLPFYLELQSFIQTDVQNSFQHNIFI